MGLSHLWHTWQAFRTYLWRNSEYMRQQMKQSVMYGQAMGHIERRLQSRRHGPLPVDLMDLVWSYVDHDLFRMPKSFQWVLVSSLGDRFPKSASLSYILLSPRVVLDVAHRDTHWLPVMGT